MQKTCSLSGKEEERRSSGATTVYVWWLSTRDYPPSPRLEAEISSLLTREELEEGARFQVDDARRQFLMGRALRRWALSRAAFIPPLELCFTRSRYGKPRILFPVTPLDFNVAHSGDIVMCAISCDAQVGIDVERIDRAIDVQMIAGRFFGPAELADLESVPVSKRAQRFFDYWTLKEAYIKAMGYGLYYDVEAVSFDLGEDRVRLLDRQNPSADKQWKIEHLAVSPGYQAAICFSVSGARVPGPVAVCRVSTLASDM